MPERGYIRFTGLTLCNVQVDEWLLPGHEITDVMLYHMFASGVFDVIGIQRAYEGRYQEYNRAQMQNYVREKDRLEILRLRAEMAELKEAKEKLK